MRMEIYLKCLAAAVGLGYCNNNDSFQICTQVLNFHVIQSFEIRDRIILEKLLVHLLAANAGYDKSNLFIITFLISFPHFLSDRCNGQSVLLNALSQRQATN